MAPLLPALDELPDLTQKRASAIAARTASSELAAAMPESCASRATARAMSWVRWGSSSSAGSSGAVGSFRAGERAPSARAAASIIPSVTRRAPTLSAPSPTAGKM